MTIRNAIADDERISAENEMISRIASLASFRFAQTVLLYYPIKSEPDLLPLAKRILSEGKGLAFPLCHTESCTLTYHYVNSLDELTEGTYGTKEPSISAPLYIPDKSKNDMILVPGISFDRRGFRLGYGKGYYDRYLSVFGGTQIGITFNKLFIPELPHGHYDRKVNTVVTEKGVFAVL
jgi:5-formyltetrahydrofolate cyclo-ligase